MKDTMKALDPRSVIRELMSHYLQGKCYNSETFISYVARDVRAHGDKFTTEDRAICKEVAAEKIKDILDAFENEVCKFRNYACLAMSDSMRAIYGNIDMYDLKFTCKCSKKEFMQVFNSVDWSEKKKFAKRLLTKAFIGK